MGISSDLFYTTNPDDDTLYRRVVPSEDQLQYLQENWQNLAEYLKSSTSKHFGVPCNTWIQGSYKYGTLIRPVTKGLEYDVDLGLYLTPNDEMQLRKIPDSASYRGYIRSLLEVYTASDEEADNVETPSKDKCERLHYKRDFHIDVPAYKLIGNNHMLAVLPNFWEESNPKTLYIWFKTMCGNARDGAQLKRFIQYLKNWAAQEFLEKDKEYQPSSIMLTVLATNAYSSLNSSIPNVDDDGFTIIVDEILAKFKEDHSVLNPVDSSENLNRLSDRGTQNFLNELEKLQNIAHAAGRTNSRFQASRIWEQAFGHFFPIDAESYASENLPARIAPEIEIDVLPSKEGVPYISGAKNSINSVPKNCWLNFSITNYQHLPLGCTVEWVVRNAGKEAMNTNDMGHKCSGQSMFEHQEHTAYHGTHFMDCSVYDTDGSLYSFRRVPVAILRKTIQQIKQPNRNNYRQYGRH